MDVVFSTADSNQRKDKKAPVAKPRLFFVPILGSFIVVSNTFLVEIIFCFVFIVFLLVRPEIPPELLVISSFTI